MKLHVEGTHLEMAVTDLIVAGWTGRDANAVNHHIAELQALGVAPPSEVPLFYRVAHTLLQQAPEIQVLGGASSGEVEPVLVRHNGDLYLGLGSDHTDRELETVSVAASKQACAKPVSGTFWRFDQLAAHLDQLQLRCEIEEDGAWRLYQEGPLASIQPLAYLAGQAGLVDGQVMFCGTLGAIGGVRPASRYRMALTDPVHARRIDLAYAVRTLPIIA